MATGCGSGDAGSVPAPEARTSAARVPAAAAAIEQPGTHAVAGYRRDFTIVPRDGTVTLTSRLDGADVRTYENAQLLAFVDGRVSFDGGGIAGQVYRLYQAAFNRVPDGGGLGFWIDAAERGATLPEMADAFIASAEFQRTYGPGLSAEAFVRLLYRNTLHREGDSGGIAWWTAGVTGGTSRAAVLAGFAESAENRNNVAAAIAAGIEYVPPAAPGPQQFRYGDFGRSAGTTAPLPEANPLRPGGSFSMYNGPRGMGFGDFNRDGCTDMVAAPTYFDHKPAMPIEIRLGDCKGGFVDGTARIVRGTVPVTGSVNQVFVRDFNGDGLDDILLIDQGMEDKDALNPGFDGAPNLLLLSDASGRLTLQPSSFMDDNAPRFNHISAVGDLNGDGVPDLLLVRLGGPKLGYGGVQAFINDGRGHFRQQTAQLLPDEVVPGGAGTPFEAGVAAIGDLDGDGIPELVLGGYGDKQAGAILKRSSLAVPFAVVRRFAIPTQYAGIGYFAETRSADERGLGASGIAIADLDGDGRKDIAVIWEGSGRSRLQLLRGRGALAFDDVSATWLDGVTIDLALNGGTVPVNRIDVADINHDGVDDLVLDAFFYQVDDLAVRSPYLVFAAGEMHYQDITGGLGGAALAARSGAFYAGDTLGLRVVDLDRDGKLDFLGVRTWDYTEVPPQMHYFRSSEFVGAVAQ